MCCTDDFEVVEVIYDLKVEFKTNKSDEVYTCILPNHTFEVAGHTWTERHEMGYETFSEPNDRAIDGYLEDMCNPFSSFDSADGQQQLLMEAIYEDWEFEDMFQQDETLEISEFVKVDIATSEECRKACRHYDKVTLLEYLLNKKYDSVALKMFNFYGENKKELIDRYVKSNDKEMFVTFMLQRLTECMIHDKDLIKEVVKAIDKRLGLN